jgi:hypothetical protein
MILANISIANRGTTYFDGVQHQFQMCVYNDAAWARYQSMLEDGSLCRNRVSVAVSVLNP